MERLASWLPTILAVILAIGLIAVIFVKPSIVEVGPSVQKETLDVSADGSASADPNLADIFVTVETTATTAQTAQSNNADIVNKLRLALVGTGLVKEVTTTSFNIYPDYTYDPDTGKATITGYRVTHNLKINTDKVNGVGKILDTATANGASTIDYVQFSLSDDKAEDLKKQALGDATSKAKDKAKTLANAASVTLGKPIKISESSYFQLPIFYGGELMAAAVEKATTQTIPGQIEVTATVAISYEIS